MRQTNKRGRLPKQRTDVPKPASSRGKRQRTNERPTQETEDVDTSFEGVQAGQQEEEALEERAEPADDPGRPPVLHVRTRRIAKSVTRRKWTVLSPESRSKAIAILRDIQRPVLMAIKNENRRTVAQAMLDAMINRIDRNLENIPLPQGSKERDFDYERVINENREMEASLVPELHLIEQLEKEIEREKALLKNDEDQLNQLTKNAAREESLRKQQMKKEMASAKQPLSATNLASLPPVTAYDVTQDDDMMDILKSLSSRLTTMDSNLSEMKEVRTWINRAEESLGEVLRRLGDSSELDRVYGAELM